MREVFIGIVYFKRNTDNGHEFASCTGDERDTYEEAKNDLPTLHGHALRRATIGPDSEPMVLHGEVKKIFVWR